jgi:hypothetical protein
MHMLKLIAGLPKDVLAVEAIGKVTDEDYRTTLIPLAERMMAKGPMRMLYVVGGGSTGFELTALWDDGAFGLKHWHDFSDIAVVTDQPWLKTAASMFAPLVRAEVRLFDVADLPKAKAWISRPAPVAT